MNTVQPNICFGCRRRCIDARSRFAYRFHLIRFTTITKCLTMASPAPKVVSQDPPPTVAAAAAPNVPSPSPTAPPNSQAADEKVNFEDISKEVYPDRTGAFNSGNWGENFIRLRCEAKIQKSIEKSPLVKLLMSSLKSRGCPIDVKRHIVAENCGEEVTGGYDTVNNQIIVCQNRVYTEEMTQAVIAHELIHMFDHCRAKMDFTNLEHIACSEIRAANLVHCSMTSSIFIGTTTPLRIAESHKDCVKAKALASLLAVRKGFPVLEGVRIVDKVFDRCYNDLEPIGRRIRLNSQHMKWAYRERFHYDYDNFA